MSFYLAALHHRTGDVIFSRDGDILSRLIRLAHLPLDRKPGRFSHVTLCAFPGLFVDSVPKVGVRLFDVEQGTNDCVRFHRLLRRHPVVLRLPPGSFDVGKFLDSIDYWTGQEYSYRYIRSLGAKPGEAFCSQFVAQVFKHAAVDFGGRLVSPFVTPTTLHDLMVAAGALDVTDSYMELDRLLTQASGRFEDFTDDLPRAAVRRRFEQSIRSAITSNITDSTSILTLKQLLEVREPISDILGSKFGIYRLIQRALEGFSYLRLSFGFLNPSSLKHWARGLPARDKAQLNEFFMGCQDDFALASKHLRDQIKELKKTGEEVGAALRDGSDADRRAVAIRCSRLLESFSDEEEEKVTKSFESAQVYTHIYRVIGRPGPLEQQFYEAFDEIHGDWLEFVRQQLELRKTFLRLVEALERSEERT